jgi:hypothetical protein
LFMARYKEWKEDIWFLEMNLHYTLQ